MREGIIKFLEKALSDAKPAKGEADDEETFINVVSAEGLLIQKTVKSVEKNCRNLK
jgi:hypothetical protein